MAQTPETDAALHSDEWRKVLLEGHVGKKYLRKAMRLLPSAPRCKACNNPFGGVGGYICSAVGLTRSRKNPNLCALCCEHMPRGGAEVETAILFADVRGSTAIAEKLGPARYADALNRFYAVATDVLIRHDATIDKFIGDEVMAFFVPGYAGRNFAGKAVEAGRALLRELGYDGASQPELPVGAGIDVGTAFVGNVGAEGVVDFTVLGDPVNTAARIQSAAGPGELLIGKSAFAAVAERYPANRSRSISVRGKKARIQVHTIPLGD